MRLSETSSAGSFGQKGNFLFICKLLCGGFDAREDTSRPEGLRTYIYTKLIQWGKRWVTILEPVTVTKGRQTPLWFSSDSTCAGRAAFKESINVEMENIATDLSEREIKRAPLARGKKWAMDKRVLSGCVCLLNTLTVSLLWEFVLWEMNEWAIWVTFTKLVVQRRVTVQSLYCTGWKIKWSLQD